MRHRGKLSRAWLLGSVATVAVVWSGAAAAEEASFNIAPQPLASALNEFSIQSRQSVLFTTDLADAKSSWGVSGQVEAAEALSALLADTGLTYRRNGDTFLVIKADGPQAAGAAGGGAEVEALIVTAQKREEDIQDVPIAISAFTQKELDAQKIEGGFDLLKGVPNVAFTKTNFSGYNFSIRGVGTQAVSATTDPGVAVSQNNTTLIVNRLFEQEYVDIERVEVLRGPQGTLYGRNATSGIINVITAKPVLGDFFGEAKVEIGNYNARRVRGHLNLPLGEQFALRLAGASTERDGYGHNEFDGSDVDDRDLWTGRVTLGWEPDPRLRVNLMWEHFEEDDRRVRTSKQLCHHDPGLGNEDFETATWDETTSFHPYQRAITSQGCLPGSLYDKGDPGVDRDDPAGAAHGAYGTPNGASLPYITGIYFGTLLGGLQGYLGWGYNPYFNDPANAPCARFAESPTTFPVNPCLPDPYGAFGQSRDLRTIHSTLQPAYRADADILDLTVDWDITDNLAFTSQTVYVEDEYYATQDYNRFATLDGTWSDSAIACETAAGMTNPALCSPGGYAGGVMNVAPGGVLMDPQLGPSSTLLAQDISAATSKQFNQEFRVVSNFDGPVNFSLGANYTSFETWNDYYVISNAFTVITYGFPFNNPVVPGFFGPIGSRCAMEGIGCTYVDPNPIDQINGEGHNYFRSANPYELDSKAIFGELYWQATEGLKFTLGARMTWDQKTFTPIPSQLLLRDYREYGVEDPENCAEEIGAEAFVCYFMGTGVGGRGYPADPDIVQEWREPTGRFIVDWSPDLSFTDDTLVYASIAHGYKGGGANPPRIAAPAGAMIADRQGDSAPPTFEPEFVDAFEIGAKNLLLDGAMTLNATAFYYDYDGYQVSKIVDRSAANENFDAEVWGAELEARFAVSENLIFNLAIGHLQTRIANGERSIDLMDRAQGGFHSSYIDKNGVEHALAYDEWVVLKPWITSASNCVAPKELVEAVVDSSHLQGLFHLCPPGGITGTDYRPAGHPLQIGFPNIGPWGGTYDPTSEAPNGAAGFFAELGGHELPNAPRWTVALGGQYTMRLPGGWDATARVDFYWQDKSFARVYNTEYDRLRSWTNTNLSFWVANEDWDITVEAYVKNAFDETPITGAFLNSDDSGLTTNVFTLDPRLIGLSIRKVF